MPEVGVRVLAKWEENEYWAGVIASFYGEALSCLFSRLIHSPTLFLITDDTNGRKRCSVNFDDGTSIENLDINDLFWLGEHHGEFTKQILHQ